MFTVPPKYHKTSIVYIVLLNIVVLGATFTLFLTTRNNDNLTIQEGFQQDSEIFVTNLEQQLERKNLILQTFQNHINGSDTISQTLFDDFTQRQTQSEFSNWSFGWVAAPDPDSEEAAVSTKRWDESLGRWVVQEGTPEFSIAFINADPDVQDALGHDLSSHPELKTALAEAALNRNSVALANPAPFLPGSGSSEIVVINPIWGPGEPGQAETQNTDKLLGYSLGIIHINSLLIETIQEQNFRDISIEVNDFTSLLNQNALFSNQAEGQEASSSVIPEFSGRFEFGSNEWQVKIVPNSNYAIIRRGALPWTLLFSGILVTLVINGLTWFIVFETVAIREQVIERTEALNSTNELLWTSTNELNKTKTLLKMKIIEQEKASVELESMQSQLEEETGGIDTDILENMTKEIRTPMNGMLGVAEMLNQTELDQEQIDFVQTIKSNGHNLLSTINDLLDFSKLESGEMPIVLAPFDLRRTLEEAMELVAYNAHQKGMELILDIDKSVPAWIDSDERRVHQISSNLLSNAVNFSESGNIVMTVTAEETNAQVALKFVVKDEGIGIAQEEVDSLFEMPDKKTETLRDRFLTSGFSLGVSKRLAEFLGGDITVKSEEGKGSEFTFTILANRADPIITHSSDLAIQNLQGKTGLIIYPNHESRRLLSSYLADWDVISDATTSANDGLKLIQLSPAKYDFILMDAIEDEKEFFKFIHTLKLVKQESIPIFAFTTINNIALRKGLDFIEIAEWLYKPIKKQPLYSTLSDFFLQKEYAPADNLDILRTFSKGFAKNQPLDILVAEDNSINQKIAVSTLSKLGYKVDFVSNGLEAMDRVVKKKYDLVFMDIHMPRMSGISAIKGIKRSVNRNLREKPVVIAMTNEMRQKDKEDCLTAGANGFILKPLKVDHLVRVLKDVHAFKTGQQEERSKSASSAKQTSRLHALGVEA